MSRVEPFAPRTDLWAVRIHDSSLADDRSDGYVIQLITRSAATAQAAVPRFSGLNRHAPWRRPRIDHPLQQEVNLYILAGNQLET